MSESGGNVIVLEKVSRTYPAQGDARPVRALRNVSMQVRRGGRVAIMGESGSGKSTLLNLLGGLDLPSDGGIVVNGQDLTHMNERELAQFRSRSVGFVFQTFNLLPTLNATENVELPMETIGLSKNERSDRSRELLEAVGMAERAEHRPQRLSGGEQQRVAIARALANRPALILADEPTGNLDRKSRGQVMRLLTKVNEQSGTCLVVVTHDPNAAAHCERTFRIHRGRLVGETVVTARAAAAAEPEEPDEPDEPDDDDGDDEKDA